MSQEEIKDLNDKLQKILDILLGDGDKKGLVEKVNRHEEWIKDKERSNQSFKFDLFRQILSVVLALIVALLTWTVTKVSKALDYERLQKTEQRRLE